jgi:hypothetical protein
MEMEMEQEIVFWFVLGLRSSLKSEFNQPFKKLDRFTDVGENVHI